jgi:hypothetical protein
VSMSELKASKMERTQGALALFGAAAAGDVSNSQQIVSPGAAAAANVTLAAPAITPHFAGLMHVEGGMTVTATTPGTIVTFQLLRGVTVLAQRRATSGASGLANVTFAMLDPAQITSSTVYSIVATPAASTVAIAANEGNVTVTETGA